MGSEGRGWRGRGSGLGACLAGWRVTRKFRERSSRGRESGVGDEEERSHS